MQEIRRFRPSTISRRFSVATGADVLSLKDLGRIGLQVDVERVAAAKARDG